MTDNQAGTRTNSGFIISPCPMGIVAKKSPIPQEIGQANIER